jgi:hypothetical protein
MTKQRLLRAIAALGLGLVLVGAPTIANATPAPTPTLAAPKARDATTRDQPRSASYAAREAVAPRAADFKGNGAGIYIGGSTLAVVLVVVLVLVLL